MLNRPYWPVQSFLSYEKHQNFLISPAYNFLPGWHLLERYKVGRRYRREGETKDISLSTLLKLSPGQLLARLKDAEEL